MNMDKNLERAGYEIIFNPTGDGNCFYSSAAKQQGLETQSLKNEIFNYLEKHQFDVSIYSWFVLDYHFLTFK